MGPVRRALCTGVLAATALTPAAYAADGAGGVSVAPAAPAPGTDVTLEVAECAERTAVAVSSAFVSEVRLTLADGVLAGESRVRSTLTAGTYPVRVDCGESARTGTITVAPARKQPGGTAESPAASPVAPVDAGGGGAARTVAAADESEEGPGAAQTVTGLFLAAAATAAVVRSRVRRDRGTH
ncbi:hypothetical protein JL475_10995 [Streptomyces sp. M2CJ-2]|uniref:hypothetical protein n=1 Tax=Streptomyces sp. M2CJ-2 TaxID=2803948 RepID=UPI001923DA22|nr:hypothetical protein [Streptomyces sp. M2CJ-2]MBL3666507.1 hypothetical protein [Streptomyces sp. M2CJ-2]